MGLGGQGGVGRMLWRLISGLFHSLLFHSVRNGRVDRPEFGEILAIIFRRIDVVEHVE
jgi:hypothetical protein